MKKPFALILAFLSFTQFAIFARPTPEDPIHEQLRVLRTNMLAAIASGDIDRQLQYVHSNVVVTWQNNEVARGHQGLRDFYSKTGKSAFKGYKVPPSPDDLSILYGDDTAISFGETVAMYELFGRPFDFKNRWTATIVKEGAGWQLVSYHVSLNALDNPLLQAAQRSLMVAAGLAGAIGIVIGVFIGKAVRKRA